MMAAISGRLNLDAGAEVSRAGVPRGPGEPFILDPADGQPG
jgi:hypothetical protein